MDSLKFVLLVALGVALYNIIVGVINMILRPPYKQKKRESFKERLKEKADEAI